VLALDDPPPVRIENASGIIQELALSLVETRDDNDIVLPRQIDHALQSRRVQGYGSLNAHAFQIVARNRALGEHHHIRVPARGFNNQQFHVLHVLAHCAGNNQRLSNGDFQLLNVAVLRTGLSWRWVFVGTDRRHGE
jgi:hypothetical protein